MVIWIVKNKDEWVFIADKKSLAINYIKRNELTIMKGDCYDTITKEGCCTLTKTDTYYNGA